ncbi:hypothetical protein Syun_002009 [Stephania yunnanensis]|uniref:Transposase, Ptta/En/Spm, plant n=1 Tax=Stephania yunnanensis TaxID=152371 RepID=A0AAP0Q8D2_9MAGN
MVSFLYICTNVLCFCDFLIKKLRTVRVHQGESSRKNRAEEQNLTSAVSETQDPCVGMRINSPTPTSPSSAPNTMNTPDQEQVLKKKTRGPTTMKKFENTPRLKVQFNERGQPIGPNSVQLSNFLGYIGRKMVPITREKWSLVRSGERDKLWSAVQEKFIIPEAHRHFVIMKIRQLWNTWKSRITKFLKEAVECGETEDYIDSKVKPSEVSDQEWMVFQRQRSSPQFIEKSKRFQELRAKQKLPYTLGRKGYARLEEEMKNGTPGQSDISRTDLWVRGHTKKDGRPANDAVAETMEVIEEFQGRSSSSTYSISKDPVAQVFGAEHSGAVRGLGFGATPSKVGATVSNPITGLVTNLQKQVNELRSQCNRLTNDLSDDQNKDQQRTNETESPIFLVKNCKSGTTNQPF